MQENTGPICPMQQKENAISAHSHPTTGPCAVDERGTCFVKITLPLGWETAPAAFLEEI